MSAADGAGNGTGTGPRGLGTLYGAVDLAVAPSAAEKSRFDLRFESQDRPAVLEQARAAIEALVPVVQGLASQPSLSPWAQVALRAAQDALRQQMNYAALASDRRAICEDQA